LCVPSSRKLFASLLLLLTHFEVLESAGAREGKAKKLSFIEKDNLEPEHRTKMKLIVFIMIIGIRIIYTARCYELEIIFRGAFTGEVRQGST
jgi:hypothetical protein